MKLGFTGTQAGMTKTQKEKFEWLITQLDSEDGLWQFHHGDCIGADSDAYYFAVQADMMIVSHPPVDPSKRAFLESDETWPEKEYLDRNMDIAMECDILVATPKEYYEARRSGTWATVRYAQRLKKPVFIIYPNGTTEGAL